MSIRIRYRSGEDDVTERVISHEIVEPPNAVHAFCELRNAERTFILSRIESAVDIETGEVISDIWLYYGLPSLKPVLPQMPVFPEKPQCLTTEEIQRQRNSDKQALFGRFKLEVIADAKRAQLYAFFENRCFRCSSIERLNLDHHTPMYLGGRLVPGNIVILCSACNMLKLDKHPRDFYSDTELSRVQPLLEAELSLFDFRFDWTRWSVHPKEYLMSLGVSESNADAFIKTKEDGVVFSIEVNLE